MIHLKFKKKNNNLIKIFQRGTQSNSDHKLSKIH